MTITSFNSVLKLFSTIRPPVLFVEESMIVDVMLIALLVGWRLSRSAEIREPRDSDLDIASGKLKL